MTERTERIVGEIIDYTLNTMSFLDRVIEFDRDGEVAFQAAWRWAGPTFDEFAAFLTICSGMMHSSARESSVYD